MSETCIIMPLYNDWAAVAQLIGHIDPVVADWPDDVTILLVNDGSQDVLKDGDALLQGCVHIKKLLVIDLVCNQGHQRAIAVGLVYAHQQACFDRVFVMDSDGEDPPSELADLRAASLARPDAIITADRVSRSEGKLFKFCYRCYKFLFALLTGFHIRFGNFSAIPAHQLARLVHYPELWNNYSGCVKKSRIPLHGIPSHRGKRYVGPSKMNFVALVLHGFGAISVYWDVLLVRLLVGLAALWLTFGVLLAGTHGLSSGWGGFLLGTWSVLSVSLFVTVLALVRHLNARSHVPFVPARQAPAYIGNIRVITK